MHGISKTELGKETKKSCEGIESTTPVYMCISSPRNASSFHHASSARRLTS
jgi:hypothetical protein